MAEDDQDRAREEAAEREAEMERVGQDPDRVNGGSDSPGTQSADTGTPREGSEGESEDGDGNGEQAD